MENNELSKVSLFALILVLISPVIKAETSKKPTQKEVDQLLLELDSLWRSGSSRATMVMDIKTQNYNRQVSFKTWTKGDEKTLILIKKPEKERGIATLKIGDEMMNYLPNIGKTIKFTEALRNERWMGSHFTNNDLLQASKLRDTYKGFLYRVEKMGADDIWYISGKLRKGKISMYKMVNLIVNKQKKYLLSQQFYDQHKKLVREMRYSRVKIIGKRHIPMVIELLPKTSDLKGESSRLEYTNLVKNIKLRNEIFSIAHLENL